MTPDALAALHARAFPPGEAWSAQAFADTMGQPHCALWDVPGAFALTRTVAGESELLTLATDPAARRCGHATLLVSNWLDSLPGGTDAFLEVAADNAAARALYLRHGFRQTGVRRGYYVRRPGGAVDAVLMSRALTPR